MRKIKTFNFKPKNMSVATFIVSWSFIIWGIFTLALLGVVYSISDKTEYSLINGNIRSNILHFSQNLSYDQNGFSCVMDEPFDEGYYVIVIDNDNQYVYGECTDELKTVAIHDLSNLKRHVLKTDQQNYYYIVRNSPHLPDSYQLCGLADLKKAETILEPIKQFSFWIITLSFLSLVILNIYIRFSITKSLNQMCEQADSISKNLDFSISEHQEYQFKEISTLSHAYERLFEKLSEILEKQDQFNSDVSHELRTPLTVIQAQCQLSLEKAISSNDQDSIDALEVISRQSDRMRDLIETLLELSRLKMDSHRIHPELFDLTSLIESACEDMEYATGCSHKIFCHLEDVEITADMNLTMIAIRNLLSNAIKYSKPGTEIQISCGSLNDHEKYFRIQDHGYGISKENLTKIFDSFYRDEYARSQDGFGLGLTLTQKIMEQHGGRIEVSSQKNEGSTFTLIWDDNFTLI